jgi:hyperosmotically inducible periplasmic protein
MRLDVVTAVIVLAATPCISPAYAQSQSASQTRPTDDELSSVIATKIANDKTLSADAIKVTVKDGVVSLSGMVGKDADKVTAEQLARVPGVVRVENKLTSREKATTKTKDAADAVANTTKKGAAKTKDVAGKTGDVVTDGWISTRIKTKFMGDESLRASDIKVDTNDHVVTLTGAVPNATARQKAVEMAKDVEGVHRVIDKLKVVGKTP